MGCCDAGIVLCFQVFGLAQFTGERLTAVAVLLGLFGVASLPLTYFLHFFFTVSDPYISRRYNSLHVRAVTATVLHSYAHDFQLEWTSPDATTYCMSEQ